MSLDYNLPECAGQNLDTLFLTTPKRLTFFLFCERILRLKIRNKRGFFYEAIQNT